MTGEGNCIKLGDFGSAVKMKAHTTVPGELKGFVGTQGSYYGNIINKTTLKLIIHFNYKHTWHLKSL